MKIASIAGARPQFVKCALVGRALRGAHASLLIHPGQHYDRLLSQVFFDELEIPRPDHHLGVGSAAHGAQTGRMLERIEGVLVDETPDLVLVFGDTNTTLAGALAAAKLKIPVAHVEAGLRCGDRWMPEEINRVVTDHLATLLFCPAASAAENLDSEGITRGVHVVGDVMLDAVRHFAPLAERRSEVLQTLDLQPGDYLVATVHRAANTEDPARLRRILGALEALEAQVILPLHPRTEKALAGAGMRLRRVRAIEPLGYLDMLVALKNARMVLTDSGGLQKEAYWLGVPCATLRASTEWQETVAAGWNVLVDADPERIGAAVDRCQPPATRPPLFGDGTACEAIAEHLKGWETRGDER